MKILTDEAIQPIKDRAYGFARAQHPVNEIDRAIAQAQHKYDMEQVVEILEDYINLTWIEFNKKYPALAFAEFLPALIQELKKEIK